MSEKNKNRILTPQLAVGCFVNFMNTSKNIVICKTPKMAACGTDVFVWAALKIRIQENKNWKVASGK